MKTTAVQGQIPIAERLGFAEPCSSVFRMIRGLREKVPTPAPLIDLSIGAPDGAPGVGIVAELKNRITQQDQHSYPPGKGERILRDAIATWYSSRFGVSLDPDREVLPVIGAKRVVIDIALALAEQATAILAPTIGYPSYTVASRVAGAPLVYYQTCRTHAFAPNLESVDEANQERASLLYCNYPNNPTGAVLGAEGFERLIDFGNAHDIVICHDNPYSEIVFDDNIAPSILQFPRGKETAIEIFSFSKTFNMAGWRIACVVGRADVISLLHALREDLDSGLFSPIQYAAARALDLYSEYEVKIRQSMKYEKRRDVVIDALKALNWDFFNPGGGMYVWAKAPTGDAMAFVRRLYEMTGVLFVPGDAYGPDGKGWIRIGLVAPCNRLEEAFGRIEKEGASLLDIDAQSQTK